MMAFAGEPLDDPTFSADCDDLVRLFEESAAMGKFPTKGKNNRRATKPWTVGVSMGGGQPVCPYNH